LSGRRSSYEDEPATTSSEFRKQRTGEKNFREREGSWETLFLKRLRGGKRTLEEGEPTRRE